MVLPPPKKELRITPVPAGIDYATLETLQSEAAGRRLTVIVTGDEQENIAFANQLAASLPGTVINEYRGHLKERGQIFVTPSLTSMLEQDACLILQVDSNKDPRGILISKNRSGRLGYANTLRLPSP